MGTEDIFQRVYDELLEMVAGICEDSFQKSTKKSKGHGYLDRWGGSRPTGPFTSQPLPGLPFGTGDGEGLTQLDHSTNAMSRHE